MFHKTLELFDALNLRSGGYLVCAHGKDYLVKPLHVWLWRVRSGQRQTPLLLFLVIPSTMKTGAKTAILHEPKVLGIVLEVFINTLRGDEVRAIWGKSVVVA